jgi:Zn-dependent M16 (insulinase) family peptidase
MSTLSGFELLKEQSIPELNTKARLFRHARTGAQLLSLENNDENKVFGISFRTPPKDSTGVAHIMEHAVLCGSSKYPVKEPFVELMKGSLNTFLNAMTFPDKTCYPVASQNLQDFYNLVDVYMDAVLHPLIPPHTLQQEGWHYELDSLDAPLTFKGVVFNEMKGAFSNPDDLLGDRARQSLFPDNSYSFDYGGDPRHIPDLTYAQFKSFHDTYYHPSNAYIYFWGDDDPEQRLRLMDSYLRDYQPIQVDSAVTLQPRYDTPRRVAVAYDPGEEAQGKKGMLVVNWLLPETHDASLMLGLTILNHILIGTPASPLRKALVDSGLGEDLAGGGLDWMLRQMMFSTGMKGMLVGEDYNLVDEPRLEALILGTLRTLADSGIDPDTVAASLNTTEFALRENNTGSFPRGLWLMFRAFGTWLYDREDLTRGDPFVPLAFEAPLDAIKEKLAAGERYFEGLIQEYFVDNPHRTTLVMQPELGLNQRDEAVEQQRLDASRASLSQAGLEKIIQDTRQLKERQSTPDTPEALATIPGLKLSDLDKQNKLIPLSVSEQDGCKLVYHDLFTNGIVYLDLGLNLHSLPQEYLPYVSLFGRALLQMGTDKEDFVRLLQRIGRSTGGISPTSFTSAVSGAEQSVSWLFLRGKATLDKVDELFAILHDVLLTAKLDNPERFRQMVLEEKADLEAGLVPAGSRVVNTRLRALFNEADWAAEQMGGISYLFFLRQLAEAVDQDWPSVLARLEEMRRILLNRAGLLCNITLDQANWAQVQPGLTGLLRALPAAPPALSAWQPAPAARFEGLTIPAQVNYVGKGADLYRLGFTFDGSANVVLKYLNATFLWERVRVQGGAYGGFAAFSQRSGVFTFLSYRDPNLLSTLREYDQAANFLRHLELSQAELVKTIIGAIGDLDAYQLPDAKGYTALQRYLVGETDAQRQVWRDQVLSATPADFHAFGESLQHVKEAGLVVVLGSPDAIERANAERDGFLEVKKVL